MLVCQINVSFDNPLSGILDVWRPVNILFGNPLSGILGVWILQLISYLEICPVRLAVLQVYPRSNYRPWFTLFLIKSGLLNKSSDWPFVCLYQIWRLKVWNTFPFDSYSIPLSTVSYCPVSCLNQFQILYLSDCYRTCTECFKSVIGSKSELFGIPSVPNIWSYRSVYTKLSNR